MSNKPVFIEVEILEVEDLSVQCIHALQQVMESFRGELSANGRDRKAVYAWFVQRYNCDTPKITMGIKGGE